MTSVANAMRHSWNETSVDSACSMPGGNGIALSKSETNTISNFNTPADFVFNNNNILFVTARAMLKNARKICYSPSS